MDFIIHFPAPGIHAAGGPAAGARPVDFDHEGDMIYTGELRNGCGFLRGIIRLEGLAPKEETMTVKNRMNKHPVTVPEDATLHEVALRMKELCIGSVLVVDQGWKLKGILTDRDIAMTAAGDSRDPDTVTASEAMTPDPISVNADADVDSALRIMRKANVRRLPVMENGRLVGLLSSADIAAEIREEIDQFIGLEEAFAKA